MTRAGQVIVALAALATAGCVTDHDALAQRPGTGGTSGTGGSAASGGAPYYGGGTGADSGGGSPVEAGPSEGPRKLTVLHGVTDAPTIFVCFAPYGAAGEGPLSGAPLPPTGMAYGHSVVMNAPPGIDLATGGFRPYVFAADPADVAGLDCPALASLVAPAPPVPDASTTPVDASGGPDGSAEGGDAGEDGPEAATPALDGAAALLAGDASAPRVRGVGLPAVPPGALAPERSYLLAVGGCLGGPGITDPSEKSVCGELYSPTTPTIAPYLVAMSRSVTAGHVSLQFLNGTPAMRKADLRLVPEAGSAHTVAIGVPTGAIRPVPSDSTQTESLLDVTNPSSKVQIFAPGESEAAHDAPFPQTLAASGVATLSNDAAYTLVLIGPYPGFGKASFWNDPVVTVVPAN